MPGSGTTPVVLFDVDGTLTDTNYLHTVAWRRAFLDHGHDVASWRIHRMIGASGSRLMEELIGDADDDVKEAWRSHFDRLVPEIRAFPGARDLVTTVQGRGGSAVLATSSPADLVEHHLQALGLSEDDFSGVTTDSDVEEAKPSPDVFLAALGQADGRAGRALVVGDTPWDVEAAIAAGLPAIGVCSGGWSADELRAAGAIEVHDDVAVLLATMGSSALGQLLSG
jgi:phosphoglycolate phosphatase-like HAD superfamily hydrolase